MLDPRLRAARDRGLDALLGRVLPSGALGPDADDLAASHRLPGALAATGHLAAAWRVLDDVAARFVTAEGDARTSAEVRSASAVYTEMAGAMGAQLATGAVRAGRHGLALRLAAWLDGLRHAPTGGALTHGPLTAPGSDGMTNLVTTVRLGALDVALGRPAAAMSAARYVAALWEAQPRPDAVLLRRDGAGALINLWTASAVTYHVLHALGPGQGHGVLGEAMTFLVRLHECGPQPGGPNPGGAGAELDLLGLAGEVLRFAERCEPHTTRSSDAVEVAAGAALLGRVTGDRRPLDLAARLSLAAADAQCADGFWLGPSEPAWDRIDQTARIVHGLHDLLAAADDLEPRVSPRPAPAGYRMVLCNAPAGRAQELADAVITERLAACVNVIPAVQSTYEWKGRVEREAEVTLMAKTTAERVAALSARLRELHPYEVPEVVTVVLEPGEGNPAYLDWLRGQVAPR